MKVLSAAVGVAAIVAVCEANLTDVTPAGCDSTFITGFCTKANTGTDGYSTVKASADMHTIREYLYKNQMTEDCATALENGAKTVQDDHYKPIVRAFAAEAKAAFESCDSVFSEYKAYVSALAKPGRDQEKVVSSIVSLQKSIEGTFAVKQLAVVKALATKGVKDTKKSKSAAFTEYTKLLSATEMRLTQVALSEIYDYVDSHRTKGEVLNALVTYDSIVSRVSDPDAAAATIKQQFTNYRKMPQLIKIDGLNAILDHAERQLLDTCAKITSEVHETVLEELLADDPKPDETAACLKTIGEKLLLVKDGSYIMSRLAAIYDYETKYTAVSKQIADFKIEMKKQENLVQFKRAIARMVDLIDSPSSTTGTSLSCLTEAENALGAAHTKKPSQADTRNANELPSSVKDNLHFVSDKSALHDAFQTLSNIAHKANDRSSVDTVLRYVEERLKQLGETPGKPLDGGKNDGNSTKTASAASVALIAAFIFAVAL